MNAKQYSALLLELDSDPKKHLQWRAFINKGRVAGAPEFSVAIQLIDRFMGAPLLAAQSKTTTEQRWQPGSGWMEGGES